MSGVDNYMDRERPVKEGDMLKDHDIPGHRPDNDREQLAALGEATRRNCWTCRHDAPEEATGRHLCLAPPALGVMDWLKAHVEGNGDVASMPAHDAPPCPGWEPVATPATVQDSLMVRPGGWRGHLPLCRGPGGTMARRMAAILRRTR